MTKSNEKRSVTFLENVSTFLERFSPVRRHKINAAYNIQAFLGGQNENFSTGAQQPALSNPSTGTGRNLRSGERKEINISRLLDGEILVLIKYNLLVLDTNTPEFNPNLYNPVFVNELYKTLSRTDPQTRETGRAIQKNQVTV